MKSTLMVTESIVSTENAALDLRIKIKTADLNFPNSLEAMERLLAAHVFGCRRCLSAVLLRKDRLRVSGCTTYKALLRRCRIALETNAAVERGAHFNEEAIEEYCFNRLPNEARLQFEQHLLVCERCAQMVQDELEFICCIRAALATRTRLDG